MYHQRLNGALFTLLCCFMVGLSEDLLTSSSPGESQVSKVASPVGKGCCQNRGLCVLGTFCHCRKHYYGRYCQHHIRERPCGKVKHDTWERTPCHLCYCIDGMLSCMSRANTECALDKEGTWRGDDNNTVMINFRKNKHKKREMLSSRGNKTQSRNTRAHDTIIQYLGYTGNSARWLHWSSALFCLPFFRCFL